MRLFLAKVNDINDRMSMQDYIGTLESEIQRLKQERTDKITKDFEDNKKMVAKILTNLCI